MLAYLGFGKLGKLKGGVKPLRVLSVAAPFLWDIIWVWTRIGGLQAWSFPSFDVIFVEDGDQTGQHVRGVMESLLAQGSWENLIVMETILVQGLCGGYQFLKATAHVWVGHGSLEIPPGSGINDVDRESQM